MRFIRLLYLLSLFGASFDIFLVFNLGFTFRISQLLLLLPLLAGISAGLLKPRSWPLGFGYLLLWSAFLLAFVPNTAFLARSVGYAFFLLFSIALLFSTVQLFRTEAQVLSLLKW